MKALILTDDNGLSYEDHHWWVTHVFLVPATFDDTADWRAFIARLAEGGYIKVTKEGHPYQRDARKASSLYPADLKSRGHDSLPIMGVPTTEDGHYLDTH